MNILKLPTLIGLFSLFYNVSNAQQVINLTGGSISNSNYSFDYSMGEVASITLSASQASVTSGFIQPSYTQSATAIIPAQTSSLCIFPNPVSDVLMITGTTGIVKAKITSAIGETIIIKTMESSIDLSAIPAGLYILQITDNKNQIQTFKIIKQ